MSAIWTTRDGAKIPVAEMTDSHLRNTIAMLEREEKRAIAGGQYHAYMADRCPEREAGEQAAMEQQIDDLLYCEEWLEVMRDEEARRRNVQVNPAGGSPSVIPL